MIKQIYIFRLVLCFLVVLSIIYDVQLSQNLENLQEQVKNINKMLENLNQ